MEFNNEDSLKKIFLEACRIRNIENVRACLQLKVDYNTSNPLQNMPVFDGIALSVSNYTGLHYAAYNKDLPLMKLLLSLPGIDVNREDTLGMTPLAVLLKSGATNTYWKQQRLKIIEEFLKNPNLVLDTKHVPISFTVLECGDPDVMKLFSKDKVKKSMHLL